MEFLYEDRHLWVAVKPANLLSEQTPKQDGFADLLAIENNGYAGVIHRLDRGVGGVMVYAKTPAAAAKLSAAVQQHQIQKEYLAIVSGVPAEKSATLRDLLFHDRNANKTYVVTRERKGVKEASLAYRVLQQRDDTVYGPVSLLQIRLHTGRTHQIRVQCASRGFPLIGDGKYGARDRGAPIGLWSYRLTFAHPSRKGQRIDVTALPTQAPFDLFDDIAPVDELPAQ